MEHAHNSLAPVGGGWLGADLAADPSRWRVELPAAVRDELVELAARRAGHAPALGDIAPEVSAATAEFAGRIREMYTSGHYFAVVTGLPHEPFEIVRDAYWSLALLLGEPVPQSFTGDAIGRVEPREPVATRRSWGHEFNNALAFHTDPADLIMMLCIRAARSGGLSYLASARMAHDRLLAEAPNLLAVLYRPLPEGKIPLAEMPQPWTPIPVFATAGGDFSTRFDRDHVEASQQYDSAPRLTDEQIAAMNALDEVVARPGVALETKLEPGEFIVLNNAEVLHARSAFEEAPVGAGRLLLRLSLSFAESPELPREYQVLYGATAAGTYRGGVWPDADQRSARVGVPVGATDRTTAV
jgi:TfdA family taurine catabolism dioxygenase TauD